MERHYCTCCGKKRNENKMKHVWYSLIRKSFWHCFDCMSTATDISYNYELIKTKSIEITTIEKEGFSEMSGMVSEVEKLVAGYPSSYKIQYKFK
ncbi:hypothetical protein SAMN04489761_3451 [Tenacibaculum sp. MAR_2009_124]|nr:hypothetical protein SAMN04489761_3451 [Tenacibaculum sp. MAR_2009_124]